MSKPDPADGSLESILASIRKNLAEQSTDALAQADSDQSVKPSRKPGLTERLAGAAVPPKEPQPSAGDDLSDLLAEDRPEPEPPAPAPASAPDSAPKAAGDKDPLWFLTRRDESVADDKLPPLGATAGVQTISAEPALTLPEVARASMPPFFGASETTPPPAAADDKPGAAVPPAADPPASAPPASPSAATSMAREVSMVAEAAEAAARTQQPAPERVARVDLNGKGPPAADPRAAPPAADAPHTRALEVMVLDLLKPMLRQWLDENMPRLVAEALSEEVLRSRAAAGSPKKT